MTNFLSDTFSSADGTNLSAHTPDVGLAWNASVFGDLPIESSACSSNTFGNGLCFNSAVPVSADYTVGVDLILNATGWGNQIGVVARSASGGLDGYAAVYNDFATQWELWTISGGGITVLDTSPTPAISSTQRLELMLSGTTLTVIVDGSTIMTDTDGSHSAAGAAGVVAFNGLQNAFLMDNLTAGDSGGGGGGVDVFGVGTTPLTSPQGIRVQLTGIPGSIGVSQGNPTRMNGLGSIAFGNSNGVVRQYFLSMSDEQIIAPIPDADTLYFSLLDGVTAHITEIPTI